VRTGSGVHAWDLPDKPPKEAIDVGYYLELMRRAAETVLAPFNAVPTQSRTFEFAVNTSEVKFSQDAFV
jgi:hypothetical protein